MKILIIDLSSGNELALVNGDINLSVLPDEREKTSDRVLEKIDKLLNLQKIKLGEVDAVAVCVGPGSWTGLKVAATLVKGFCVESDLKVIKFSVFEAIDFDAFRENSIAIIEGFGDFVYVCKGGEMACVETAVANNMAKDCAVCCSEKVAQKLGIKEFVPLKKDIIKAARDKFLNKDFVDPMKIEPLYLRASQAEIERNKRLKNGN